MEMVTVVVQTLEVEPIRGLEVALDHAASTAFQISGAVLYLTKLVEFELTLSDPVHEFDAGDRRCSSPKRLKPSIGPSRSLIDR